MIKVQNTVAELACHSYIYKTSQYNYIQYIIIPTDLVCLATVGTNFSAKEEVIQRVDGAASDVLLNSLIDFTMNKKVNNSI